MRPDESEYDTPRPWSEFAEPQPPNDAETSLAARIAVLELKTADLQVIAYTTCIVAVITLVTLLVVR